MKLTVTGSPIPGYRHLWLMYVDGFDPEKHCLPCLKGRRSLLVSPAMRLGEHVLDEPLLPYDFIYLCGVEYNFDWSRNLHLAARPKEGAVAEVEGFNGSHFRIEGAERVEIPDLPRGWRGLPDSFTTCRNYRFGVAYYGPHGKGKP